MKWRDVEVAPNGTLFTVGGFLITAFLIVPSIPDDSFPQIMHKFWWYFAAVETAQVIVAVYFCSLWVNHKARKELNVGTPPSEVRTVTPAALSPFLVTPNNAISSKTVKSNNGQPQDTSTGSSPESVQGKNLSPLDLNDYYARLSSFSDRPNYRANFIQETRDKPVTFTGIFHHAESNLAWSKLLLGPATPEQSPAIITIARFIHNAVPVAQKIQDLREGDTVKVSGKLGTENPFVIDGDSVDLVRASEKPPSEVPPPKSRFAYIDPSPLPGILYRERSWDRSIFPNVTGVISTTDVSLRACFAIKGWKTISSMFVNTRTPTEIIMKWDKQTPPVYPTQEELDAFQQPLKLQ